MSHKIRNSFSAILAFGLLVSCGGGMAQEEQAVSEVDEQKPKLGLFTTLPIYWGEGGMEDILAGETEPDWVRTELETKFEIVPLDTLEAEALEGLDRVLLAQPRPLSPSENVAFDSFLTGGGDAVIMADPMLTRHSEFGIGDRRRPQDVVLLSPIFARMGVELLFDEDQPSGERLVAHYDYRFPVNLAGRFEKRDSGGGSSRTCWVYDNGLLAQCAYGGGEAFLYADAAILDWEGDEPVPQARKDALWGILMPLLPQDENGAQP